MESWDKKFILLFLFGILFLSPFISASCNVTFGKESYVRGETVIAAMSCSAATEKSKSYTLNWTYQNGTVVESDIGTTPAVTAQFFYQSYIIPTSWPAGIFVNASLSGTGLTVVLNDSANVTAAAASTALIISNMSLGGGYLGLVGSVKAAITDENNKKISGGLCKVSILSNDELSVIISQEATAIDGEIKVSDIMPATRFDEGVDYTYKIVCYCGSAGGATECIDQDGVNVNNSIGSARGFFTTYTWLNVSTVVDKSIYHLKDEIFVCANVTNLNYSYRIPLHIYYQVRCSKEKDNYQDTDRILLVYNPDSEPDIRGISSNTTQMQCMKFIIPEEEYLMGRNSECYASTTVWVLDDTHNELLSYSATSPVFNITSDEINIEVDWKWASRNRINSIVNLSNFENTNVNVNGTGTGNIDVRLYLGDFLDLNTLFDMANMISNITVQNTTSTLVEHVDYEVEFLEDGYLELEMRDVRLNSSWFNISIDFYNLDLRQAEALEGIENKTGTFHLDVDCPSQGLIGGNIDCSITAQIEDPQVVQKEVDFTCYISDGTNLFSSLNFNQMVNKTSLTISREFAVPSTFIDSSSYVLQCHADYYNLGSRRDSFYDTFTAVTQLSSGGSSGGYTNPITGDAIVTIPEEKTEEESGDIPEEIIKIIVNDFWIYAVIIAFLLLALIVLKKGSSKSSKILFLSLFVVGIIGILYYGVIFFNGIFGESVSGENLIKDSFIRGIILTIFISLVLAFLFKILNIRGEVKFGEEGLFRNNKAMKEQEKLNKLILKNEMRNEKNLKRYRIVKIKK